MIMMVPPLGVVHPVFLQMAASPPLLVVPFPPPHFILPSALPSLLTHVLEHLPVTLKVLPLSQLRHQRHQHRPLLFQELILFAMVVMTMMSVMTMMVLTLLRILLILLRLLFHYLKMLLVFLLVFLDFSFEELLEGTEHLAQLLLFLAVLELEVFEFLHLGLGLLDEIMVIDEGLLHVFHEAEELLELSLVVTLHALGVDPLAHALHSLAQSLVQLLLGSIGGQSLHQVVGLQGRGEQFQ